jgi:glycosyltransferase involved in cell wall biosynthesis
MPHSVALLGLLAGGPSGVARYTSVLARAIDDVAPEFPDLTLELVTTVAGAETVGARNLRVRDFGLRGRFVNRGPGRLALEQLLAAAMRADLLHFFDLSGPVLAPSRPFATTIHDASVAHAYDFAPARRMYKRRLQPWALRRARAAVAVSAFARDEAVRLLGADPERVHIVHSGPGLVEPQEGQPGPTRRHPYLLYVGGLATNKNLPFLVRAFEQSGVEHELLLVGRPAPGFDELAGALRSSPAAPRIHLVQGASDRDIDALYRGATALVHASRYEGFGFTPLEAMARGCAVLASDIPPIREVSGEGALLLPPGDESAWSEAMRRVVRDESLRQDLVRRGRRAVSRYSWDSTARAVCRLLLKVGKRLA